MTKTKATMRKMNRKMNRKTIETYKTRKEENLKRNERSGNGSKSNVAGSGYDRSLKSKPSTADGACSADKLPAQPHGQNHASRTRQNYKIHL
jgi:hypothetical protein